MDARWIRLGTIELLDLRAACLGLAEVQAAGARPILLWGRAKGSLCIGPRASLGGAGVVGEESFVWVEAPDFVFAVLAPLQVVPGRKSRWTSWALAPVLAAYRQFGVRAYLEADAIWLHGRCLAQSSTACAGGWVVVASSFSAGCAAVSAARADAARPSFRAWLRDGAALSRSEWADPHEMPAEREVEEVLRARIAAQHDWRFEHCWPDARESAAIERARCAAEPLSA